MIPLAQAERRRMRSLGFSTNPDHAAEKSPSGGRPAHRVDPFDERLGVEDGRTAPRG